MLIYRLCSKSAADSVRLTLPIEWVKHHKLKPGSVMSIDMNDDRLLIRVVKGDAAEAIKAELQG